MQQLSRGSVRPQHRPQPNQKGTAWSAPASRALWLGTKITARSAPSLLRLPRCPAAPPLSRCGVRPA
eukprot:3066343-Prymnesium_polylepis.1